jgi:inactivated superfamily I helicase
LNPPRVEIHPDFAVLERRLECHLRALRREHGPLARAAVVVPTSRLRDHLLGLLARRFGALTGVEVLHHDALAAAIATEAALAEWPGASPRPFRPLGDLARQAIVEDQVHRTGGALAGYVAAVPGSVAAILATLDELREAGVAPQPALRVAGLSEPGREILSLYSGYVATLERLAALGFADRALRIASVLDHAAHFASRYRLVVHYGAYEIVGMNLELMRAVGAAAPVVHLAPGHPTAPAFAYARDFWRDAYGATPAFLGEGPGDDEAAGTGPDAPVVAVGARLLGDRLQHLYDEAESGRECAGIALLHTQGAAAEIDEAALVALDRHDGEGVPLHRVAVLARSLEPYVAALQPAARRHALPILTSAARPLGRETTAQAALRLLRVVLLDAEAKALFDLVRTGLLRGAGASDAAAQVDGWERLLRTWQVRGGRRVLCELLPAWLSARRAAPSRTGDPDEARAVEARRAAEEERGLALARLVAALDRDARPLRQARDWNAWSAAATALLGRRLEGLAAANPDAGVPPLLAALEDMQALHAAGVPFPSAQAALSRLEGAIVSATVPVGGFDPSGQAAAVDGGGIRVLDVMQARGLSFDTVVLAGMNATLFPRPVRPDPFLSDADRALLRSALRRSVALRQDALAEEHLLLALALGSAEKRLVVSWQRADDAGRAKAPSLALREIARIALGDADLERAVTAARRVPGDVLARVSEELHGRGLVTPSDAALAAALEARDPGRLGAHLEGLSSLVPDGSAPTLAAGLELLRAIEAPDPCPFDALPGPLPPQGGDGAARARPWSPSRLALLGACPQRYFFRHVLRIEEWDEPAEVHVIDGATMGLAVHAVLAETYRDASIPHPVAGSPRGGPAADLAVRLCCAWEKETAPIASRLEALVPGLWELLGGRWLQSLLLFLERDARRFPAAGGAAVFEEPIEVTLPLGAQGDAIPIQGRFDRLIRTENLWTVTDYKTGVALDDWVDPGQFLKGTRLQMAIYRLMAEAAATIAMPPHGAPPRIDLEVLGVGPRFDLDPEAGRATLDGDAFARIEEGVLESLRVLLRLPAEGLYPLHEEARRCAWCVFDRACRRAHAPTVERLLLRPELRDHRLVRRKQVKRPLLADVEAGGDGT